LLHVLSRFYGFGKDGSTVTGPCQVEIDVPLARLPWYRLADTGK